MEKLKEKIENLSEHVYGYVETKWDLTMLNAGEKSAKVVSGLSVIIMVSAFFMISLIFASIATAIFVGKMMDNMVLGFLIVSGFYLLVSIILFLARKRIFKPYFTNLFIQNLYED